MFRACQPSTLIAPGSAPRTNMAEGMVRTPVAKMTLPNELATLLDRKGVYVGWTNASGK